MPSKVITFLKGLIDGVRSKSDTTAADPDQRSKDSKLVQRKIYGDALYYELEYHRHIKEMKDYELERDQYHRRLQDSAYERNKHLRVMKLPAEILSLIFHCTRMPRYTDKFSPAETFAFSQKTEKWACITWVCRHWRNVALNDPTLWTIVPHRFTRWTPEIIERSRNAGLKVDFVGAESSHENYTYILKHSNRISELSICDSELAYIISSYGLGSTLKLEKLSVVRSPHLLSDNQPTALLPTNVFNDCDSLRYLELSGMHVFLAPNLFPSIIRTSLRHLRLSHCSFATMADFKPAISTIECLESLLLHNTLSSHAIPSSYGSHAPITLTSLKSLDLDEESAAVVWFLDNFVLTAQCKRTRIATRFSSERRGDRLKLLAAMSRPGAVGQSISAVHSVAFQMLYKPILTLAMKASYAPRNTSPGYLPADESHDLAISFTPTPSQSQPFRLDLRRETFDGIFTDIFQHFDWKNLRELSLVKIDFNFSSAMFSKTLRTTFGRLPDIRVIRVGQITTISLIDALLGAAGEPQVEILFQGLQEIYVRDTSFDYQLREQGEVEAAHFWDCLQARLESGVPIQKLDFNHCHALTKKHVYAFLGVVPKIVWDGFPVKRKSKAYVPIVDSEGSSEGDFDTTEEDEGTGEEEDDSKLESEGSSDEDDDGEDDDSDEDDDSEEDESDEEDEDESDSGVTDEQEDDEQDGSDEEETEYSESDSSSLPEYPVLFAHQPAAS